MIRPPLVPQVMAVARSEWSLFTRFSKLRWAVLGIAIIPALYAWIYLQSVWDPASRTDKLPALIVNLDTGTTVGGAAVSIGDELSTALQAKHHFGFSLQPDAESAKQKVREGRALFALIIPPHFSASALSAQSAGSGKLIVYASEGNNYLGANLAKRFAAELGHQLNESLNEKRWAAVLGTTQSSGDQLTRLKEGMAQLDQGARTLTQHTEQASQGAAELHAGNRQLADHVATLTDGVSHLRQGAQQLSAAAPPADQLNRLNDGARQLAEGLGTLAHITPELENGAQQLADGAKRMQTEAAPIPLYGPQVAQAAGQLADGAQRVSEGAHTVVINQITLASNAHALAQGVTQLTQGLEAHGAGTARLAAAFPGDEQLTALTQGAQSAESGGHRLQAGLSQLHEGTERLSQGIAWLSQTLPPGSPQLAGTATGLASSVLPVVEVDAPVANNGLGFLPNFMPIALWLGAVMTAFVFHLNRMSADLQFRSRPALLLGKLSLLLPINLAQALCVLIMCDVVLGLQPVHVGGLALTLLLSSVTFMLIILALVHAFGDVGKVLALFLLIVQLASAGGIVPIELTNDFFAMLSPWLPFTWSVKAISASTFGAFGNAWLQSAGVIALFALGAGVVATFAGRWQWVSPAEHRPAMDV